MTLLPPYTYVGAPVTVTPDGTTVITVPAGANGVLIQVFTAAVRIEFNGVLPTSTSLQLLPGFNPVLNMMGAGWKFILGQVTSGATVNYRFILR